MAAEDFIIKARKVQSAGGHFNRGVNIMRSHLCRLSKQYVAKKKQKKNPVKDSDGGLLEMPAGLLRTPLMVPAGLGPTPHTPPGKF